MTRVVLTIAAAATLWLTANASALAAGLQVSPRLTGTVAPSRPAFHGSYVLTTVRHQAGTSTKPAVRTMPLWGVRYGSGAR